MGGQERFCKGGGVSEMARGWIQWVGRDQGCKGGAAGRGERGKAGRNAIAGCKARSSAVAGGQWRGRGARSWVGAEVAVGPRGDGVVVDDGDIDDGDWRSDRGGSSGQEGRRADGGVAVVNGVDVDDVDGKRVVDRLGKSNGEGEEKGDGRVMQGAGIQR
eukprot:scaffold14721_cov185-Amphora_coffeaeformis.AAC.1